MLSHIVDEAFRSVHYAFLDMCALRPSTFHYYHLLCMLKNERETPEQNES